MKLRSKIVASIGLTIGLTACGSVSTPYTNDTSNNNSNLPVTPAQQLTGWTPFHYGHDVDVAVFRALDHCYLMFYHSDQSDSFNVQPIPCPSQETLNG